MWVLSFNVGGLMLSDMSFLAVAHYWETLPGTYWWFALGPIIEGAVGGQLTSTESFIRRCPLEADSATAQGSR